ncbi:hypothetical protein [Actinomadura hibisca]|uniref:hypothetical protein n=1 Tax=Actinomadura hibisca TaxID=68565 RepID=UPI0008366DD4|nr:hypothetical protein [Actinomadura hibisca]
MPDLSADGRFGAAFGSAAGPRRVTTVAALLVAVTALPAAVLTLPDTTLNVVEQAGDALRLQAGGLRDLLRATGLTLPALLLAVPPAAVAARRLPVRAVLLVGLLVLLAGVLTAPLAGSVAAIAAVRAGQGLGAGIVLPAVLVLVWERRDNALTALWAGTLAATLLAAMPLALRAVPMPTGETAAPIEWHTALAPYRWPAMAAFAAALLGLLLRALTRGQGDRPLPAFRHAERGQLVLPLVPAAGFAFLAMMTTYDWSPGAQLVVAGAALLALLGLALVGGRDVTAGSPLACALVMVSAGLFTYPLVAPLSGLAAAHAQAAGDPAGLPVAPFAAGAVAALLGALATVRMSRAGARTAVLAGHGLIVVAVLLALAADVTGTPWMLLAPLVPLGAGVGMALAASLRDAGVGAALFGLTLCFPAVLTGQLLVLSLQVGRLQSVDPANDAQRLYGLTAGYRLWLIGAGVLALLLAALVAKTTARRAAAAVSATDAATGSEATREAGRTPASDAGERAVTAS